MFVDGGLRGRTNQDSARRAAVACTVYRAAAGPVYQCIYKAAELLEGMNSAFQVEATALELSLSHLFRFFECGNSGF